MLWVMRLRHLRWRIYSFCVLKTLLLIAITSRVYNTEKAGGDKPHLFGYLNYLK